MVGDTRLSWICSALTEFRICDFITVCSICSLSGLTSCRPYANPLELWHGFAVQVLWTDTLHTKEPVTFVTGSLVVGDTRLELVTP